MVSVLWFLGAKSKFGRAPGACAGCVEPLEATWNQDNSYPDNPFHGFFKVEDNHVFSPNFVLNAKYAYYGTGFELAPHRRPGRRRRASALAQGRRSAPRSSPRTCGRSTPPTRTRATSERRGGNHEIKFGGGWRKTEALSQTLWPGDQVVAYDNSALDQPARARQPRGPRHQPDRLLERVPRRHLQQGPPDLQRRRPLGPPGRQGRASDVRGNGAFPNVVPGISFAGYDAPFTWSDFSPRAGLTYALDQGRKTLVRTNFARYVTQLDTNIVGYMNPSGNQGWAEFPWARPERRQPRAAERGRRSPCRRSPSGGGFDRSNPTSVASANRIDADLVAPRTSEIVAGLDHELFPDFGVSVSYTFRHYDRFLTYPRIGMTAADYSPAEVVRHAAGRHARTASRRSTRSAAAVEAGNSGRFATNAEDYTQTFHGIELAATKRLSNGLDVPAGRELQRPHRALRGGRARGHRRGARQRRRGQPDPPRRRLAGRRRPDRLAQHRQWRGRCVHQRQVGGQRQHALPAPLEARGGRVGLRQTGHAVPVLRQRGPGSRRHPARAGGAEVDSERLDTLWNVDVRLAKNFKAAGSNITLTADVFNVFNSNTELNRQRNLDSLVFSQLTDYLSPRVLRLGMRLGF